MKSSAPVCPVPTEQQPINEYQELKESWFFSWATLDWVGYLKPVFILWVMSWLIAAPVAEVSFPFEKYPAKFVLSAAAGAIVIPSLALIRLWLGWFYIRDRLNKAEIFYEESGWYDGQTWEKPEAVQERDRLIVAYQVQPILARLGWTFGSLVLLIVAGVLVWSFV